MASIGLNIDFTGYAGYLIIKARQINTDGTPGAYVHTSSAFPFNVDMVYTIPNLNPVNYIVEFWRSTGGISLDELLRSWTIDAGIFDEAIVQQFDYIVDRGNTAGTIGAGDYWIDPANGATDLHDERVAAYPIGNVRLESRGFGKYRNGDEFIMNPTGLTLQAGLTFSETTNTFSVTVYKKVAQQTTTGPSSTGDYNDINIVSADGTFDSDFYKNNNIADGGAPILTTTFPNFGLIPNTKAKFSTFGGNQRYWCLQFDAGNFVKFRGEDRNVIWLGKNESIEIFFKDGAAYAISYAGDYYRLGQRIWGDKTELNTLLLDGTQYNIADYPRIYHDYITKLDSSLIKTETQWASSAAVPYTSDELKAIYPNKGFFAVDLVAGKFRVPDMRNRMIRTLKTFDLNDANDTERTSNKPGAYQIDRFKSHKHDEATGFLNINGTGATGTRGLYNGSNNGSRDKTAAEGGFENRPENIGMMALLIV